MYCRGQLSVLQHVRTVWRLEPRMVAGTLPPYPDPDTLEPGHRMEKRGRRRRRRRRVTTLDCVVSCQCHEPLCYPHYHSSPSIWHGKDNTTTHTWHRKGGILTRSPQFKRSVGTTRDQYVGKTMQVQGVPRTSIVCVCVRDSKYDNDFTTITITLLISRKTLFTCNSCHYSYSL